MQRAALDDMLIPINAKVENAYEKAQELAARDRVSNKWTKLTNEKVCALIPSKCLSLKDPQERLIVLDGRGVIRGMYDGESEAGVEAAVARARWLEGNPDA